MGKALSIAWRGIVDTYSELFPMVGMNLVWVAISLVLSPFLIAIWSPATAMVTGIVARSTGVTEDASAALEFAVIFAVFTLVFGPNPGYLGAHNYINHLLNEHPTYFGMVWEGLRKYWARALALFGVSTLVYGVLVVNIAFYLSNESVVLQVVGVLCLYILLIWTTMQMYLLPLLIEQEDKRFRLIYRNAAVLAMDNVVVSAVLLVVTVALVAVSFAVAILITMITASLLVAIQQRATLTLLDKYKARGAALTR
jgi:uncharacterized membrane protein YesL